MSNGEGEIYWSARAGRFYQSGRRGAVSRETAISTLEHDPEANRWRDLRGRFVPERIVTEAISKVTRFIGRDQQGRPFVKTEFLDRPITPQQVTERRFEGNQQVVARTVVVTADGKTHVIYTGSKLGQRVERGYLDDLANRQAAAKLRDKGYSLSTHDVGGMTAGRTYSVRTIRVR